MNKVLFFDIETTGFSRQWDYIIELAAILYDEDSDTVIDIFHEYIKPGKLIPAKITEITGITNNQVKNCRDEKSVLMDFCEFVVINNPKSIIGHNCKAFDLGFIREKCCKYHINWDDSKIEIIDTLTIARQLNKSGKINTENCQQPTLAAYFNIEYEAHSAIEDTSALIKVYKKMKSLTKPVTRADLGF